MENACRVTNASVAVVAAVVVMCLAGRSSAEEHTGAETRRHLVPNIYVFGDSLVDVGNNDFLPPPAPRANPPYGTDFPGKNTGSRTGRFTNGYNVADLVARRLGFTKSPQAYLSMTWQTKIFDLFTCRIGANYASGGSGILDTTGNGTLTMRKQIQYFKVAAQLCGHKKILSQSLFLLSGGGNDFSAFAENHMAPTEAPAYIAKMISTYIAHIKALYDLGARRVGILDVPPIGCTPGSRATMKNGECNEGANSLAQHFNGLLRTEMARAVAKDMLDLKYSIASNYNILSDMIARPFLAGFKESEKACCGAGKLKGEVMCGKAGTTVCTDDHNEYIFWDMLHGTQATYQRGVLAFFYGPTPKYADPINFSKLVERTRPTLVADE